MGFIAELDPVAAAIGGKARSLALLAAAGHATPAGFAVTDELFRALHTTRLPTHIDREVLGQLDDAAEAITRAPFPAGFAEALEERLTKLGGTRFSVRSSFASEDDADAIAAGVYESRTDVTRAQVPEAIRAVLRSAVAPGAVAYALSRGRAPAEPPVAVLVHAFVAGDSSGAAAFGPNVSDALVLPATGEAALSSAATAQIAATVRALAKVHGPVEIEWTWRRTDDAVTFLQMRPFRSSPAPAAWPGFASLPAGERERWRWDAAHNPLPLSPAHADLVALVDEHCQTGIRQRVLGGYLFYAPVEPPPPLSIPPAEVRARFDELSAQVTAQLSALGPAPALEPALALFSSSYQPLMGAIQPAARAGRRALEEWLRAQGREALAELPALLADVESMASERRRRAGDPVAYRALFGDEAPVWDVAEPTVAERPWIPAVPAPATTPSPSKDRWREALARLGTTDAAAEQRVLTARACVAVGEDDDWLYARLQTAVRRALLAVGNSLVQAGQLAEAADIFYWPLSVTRTVATGAPAPADGRALARAGRAAVARALANPPPARNASSPAAAGTLRGWGTGGRALGRVHRHDRSHVGGNDDAVLVADTLLPTELPLLTAAAFVTETGGPLDHVAAQARERGLPAVVGAAGALEQLREGDLVLVDANQGLVIKVG